MSDPKLIARFHIEDKLRNQSNLNAWDNQGRVSLKLSNASCNLALSNLGIDLHCWPTFWAELGYVETVEELAEILIQARCGDVGTHLHPDLQEGDGPR